ncbi:MAG: cytochrome, partial [Sphingobium sp. 32-64-5]
RNVRHFAFGFGPHFCMGSHLARRELEVALREWLARVPNGWRLKPGTETTTHGGHSFGINAIELVWDV